MCMTNFFYIVWRWGQVFTSTKSLFICDLLERYEYIQLYLSYTSRFLLVANSTTPPTGSTPSPSPQPSTPLPRSCPEDWLSFRGACYSVNVRAYIPWGDAHLACLQRHAELVSIETAAEQQFLWNNVRTRYGKLWIGLMKKGKGRLIHPVASNKEHI